MSAAVPKTIYPHEGRGSRRRIAKELARLKVIDEEKTVYAKGLRALGMDSAATQILEAQPRIPRQLLVCAHCGQLTAKCTCVVDGQPLDWGYA